jgi:hypothetical protein
MVAKAGQQRQLPANHVPVWGIPQEVEQLHALVESEAGAGVAGRVASGLVEIDVNALTRASAAVAAAAAAATGQEAAPGGETAEPEPTAWPLGLRQEAGMDQRLAQARVHRRILPAPRLHAAKASHCRSSTARLARPCAVPEGRHAAPPCSGTGMQM